MTNNDELALKLKAAAEKATPGRIGDRIDGSGTIKYECSGYDGSLVLKTEHKNMQYGFVGDNGDADELFFRLCAPDLILSLLAEREADKKRIAELERDVDAANARVDTKCATLCNQDEEIEMLRLRIAELKTVSDAAEKLVRCKGRYHSEQNYRALAALFGVKTPDLPPLETEARTVSVKLPEPATEGGRGYRQKVIWVLREAMFDAGIKLEVGE